MSDEIDQAKAEFIRSTDSLKVVLAATPDDKLNWSPTDTCRSPLQIAAHAAIWVSRMHALLSHCIYQTPFESIAERVGADGYPSIYTAMRALEGPYTTREQVLDLLEASSARYLLFLDGIPAETLGRIVDLRFASFPLAVAITFSGAHVASHVAQIEYIQTAYGDHDWH